MYLEPAEFENDDIQEVAEKGHGVFLQASWAEYGKPKLYLLARTTWEVLRRQTISSGSSCLRLCWIPFTETNGPTKSLKLPTIVPSVYRLDRENGVWTRFPSPMSDEAHDYHQHLPALQAPQSLAA
ncbi:hypothetical protein NPIL_88531 [Nephila pilipes]|uniref:Uncharacterized protein n=1 Tax=Nephila pilipes TaxID=299642 RepID=A0A8X6QGV5_NEPPI|nr:hypothetical protein NPIL_88531 [Nephila pilipes]